MNYSLREFDFAISVYSETDEFNMFVGSSKNFEWQVFQKEPCSFEAERCPASKLIGTFEECPLERQNEIREYQTKRHGKKMGDHNTMNSVCLNIDDQAYV